MVKSSPENMAMSNDVKTISATEIQAGHSGKYLYMGQSPLMGHSRELTSYGTLSSLLDNLCFPVLAVMR